MSNEIRAEILVNGLVQGVGFRFFVFSQCERLGLKGFTKNLYTGEVLTIVEGSRYLIEELYKILKVGSMHSQVKNHSITWGDIKNEFTRFEVKY